MRYSNSKDAKEKGKREQEILNYYKDYIDYTTQLFHKVNASILIAKNIQISNLEEIINYRLKRCLI